MWNHDLTKAPRGSIRIVPAGKDATRKIMVPTEIIAASACGVVCISYWIDAERRWTMFTREVGPIAWQPYDPARTKTITARNGKVIDVPDLPPHPTMATSWFADLLASRKIAA